jgi:putative FmdB family regulatory protein
VPLYEFTCKCGNRFEQIVPVGTGEALCTKCQGVAERIMSLFNWKWGTKLNTDGEGFKSIQFSKDEYDCRWRDRNYDYREVT